MAHQQPRGRTRRVARGGAVARRPGAPSPGQCLQRRRGRCQTVGAGAPSGDGDTQDCCDAEPPAAPGPVSGRPERPVPLPEPYRRGLRRTVAAEAVLGVIVPAITTVLTGTQPSRAAAQNVTAQAVAQLPFLTSTQQ
ncbi:hypothetical protein [Streptomyces sp. NPDC057580]|uniref:hypothetical protein n=1 Tax=Streptomyces sp. NPDC057580 TaxID=3346173 RepID=UPI0036941695